MSAMVDTLCCMINRAKTIALTAHGNQTYGAFPYVVHLAAVEEIISRFGFGTIELRSAAWLHDILEDTALTKETVRMEFGSHVADLVHAVTDGKGATRAERKAEVYVKIRLEGRDALILKLADRIANVEAGGKVAMYRKEHEKFKNELYNASPEIQPMWDHLDNLLITKDTTL